MLQCGNRLTVAEARVLVAAVGAVDEAVALVLARDAPRVRLAALEAAERRAVQRVVALCNKHIQL